ncbi:hypothetical protein ACWELB_19675 [Streptomyces asiaticus]|uniref:hypothetical protein n=1 Tax=Streptomyces asiaticus TaxID=114695 RepID=UPI003D74344E
MRVHERGVGETRACGTGACATGAAARARQLRPAFAVHYTAELPGGRLHVVMRHPNQRHCPESDPGPVESECCVQTDELCQGLSVWCGQCVRFWWRAGRWIWTSVWW